MAKRKQKTRKKGQSWWKGVFHRDKKKRQQSWVGPTLARIAKATAVLAFLTTIVIGVSILDKYVQQTGWCAEQMVQLELVAVPDWVNDNLKEKVYLAATADGKGLTINPDAARRVQENIEALAGWIDNVRVTTMSDRLRVEGYWRKPLAEISLGRHQFHVDADSVVLEPVAVPNLPIVEVVGLAGAGERPQLGEPWKQEDLAAGIAILIQLDRMDQLLAQDNPLLFEIDRIDVGNFMGRKNPRMPHITLYTTDDTPVIWGAEIGQWTKHLEATDREKLAKLYGYYERVGTLLNATKYINLRDPQDKVIPLPIDKY